ncbi:uncharacterized protein I303_103731 [Kwoniella dejecticola CBS 10117]|uniref:Glycosyl transferase CAP10 domain-containing protein n=1 Tax=Kwoniella dejecticola CBS 10117 TaxID=1296121 RepID=A0A1A6A7J8_9TREE|nr:uncharacterized protein I303_03748 [Kwoniella dejecticola CBS 10117]OBR86031.1 hypothetical protein I303_03748 [Kwoniella dejecticola CBS 10117]
MPRLLKALIVSSALLFLFALHHFLPPSTLTQIRQSRPGILSSSSSSSSSSNRRSPQSSLYSVKRPPISGGWSRNPYEESGLLIDHRGLTHWDREDKHKLHPIKGLIERGKELAEKQKRKIESIRTIEDAVDDYVDSFGMKPPKGFDYWYKFTQSIKPNPPPVPSLIPLAHRPFLSFLSLPVEILRERIEIVRSKGAIFTFTFVPPGQGDEGTACDSSQNWVPADYHKRGKGRVIIDGVEAWGWRCNNKLTLLLPILSLLPDDLFTMDPPLEIAFSSDDGPRGMVHNTFREKAESLAKSGKTWPQAQLDKAEQSMRWTYGWAWSCPDDSPLKTRATDLVLNDLPQPDYLTGGQVEKSFIADFDRSADYCSDPELMGYHRAAVEMTPVVATCKTMWNSDIVGVPLDGVFEKVPYVKWEDKSISKAFWRGSATGLFHSRKTPWRSSQRERLHFFANNETSLQDTVSVLLPNGEIGEYQNEKLNDWLDVGLSGVPSQCDQADGSCDDMLREINFMGRVRKEDSLKYKYVIDVDGNGWSSRFRRLLSSNNVVLKSTLYPEWFHEMLIPWYHYVPIKLDYSDIHDIMAFFNGSPDGQVKGHDELAREIAQNGWEFVENRWRLQDMQSFMFLLILEHWRMMSEDRQAASYDP